MKKHILIVGVDEINTKELKDILVPFYRIDIVNSAEKIIEFLEIANTDLILVDLNKSEMMKLNRVYSCGFCDRSIRRRVKYDDK